MLGKDKKYHSSKSRFVPRLLELWGKVKMAAISHSQTLRKP